MGQSGLLRGIALLAEGDAGELGSPKWYPYLTFMYINKSI
jgi:hypothetical protein